MVAKFVNDLALFDNLWQVSESNFYFPRRFLKKTKVRAVISAFHFIFAHILALICDRRLFLERARGALCFYECLLTVGPTYVHCTYLVNTNLDLVLLI